MPRGATLECNHAMYAPSAHRSLISYRDLRGNGIHILTTLKNSEKVLELIEGSRCLATTYVGTTSLYELAISNITTGTTGTSLHSGFKTSQELASSIYTTSMPVKIRLWHSCMDHSGTTMFLKMLPILSGHEVCQSDANKMRVCTACAQYKLIQRPSRWKLPTKLPPCLHRLHGEICGPIIPTSKPFRLFLVLVDIVGTDIEASLLNSRNIVFAKVLAMLIKFRNHHPHFLVKILRMDNAKEFRSQHFEDYCLATSIELIYSISYEHSQNGLSKAFIKKI